MKRYILLFIFAGVFASAGAQQALTMYNMDRVMQTQFINPSVDVPYKFHIGGLLVPIVGQLPPPIYFNYGNNSFYYNHILHMGKGDKADNLVLDIPLFMDKLKKTTHMRFDTQIELLNLGFKLENMFLTVAITEKFKYGMSLPYDIFEFTLNGNMPYMQENKPHDFSGFGVDFTHYREFAVGGSMQANDKLSFGGRAKILFGMANVNTNFKELSLYTDPEDYSMTFTTDMKMHSSLPVYFDMNMLEVDSAGISLNEASMTAFEDNPASYFLNLKNIGLGFDFGASYKLTPEIDLYASITDFGFISWNTNPQNFLSKGEYDFHGLEVELWENDEEMDESLKDFADTLFNIFKPSLVETGYMTWLPTSFYIGGKYKFHELLHFTALYRGEFYRKSYMHSLTIGVNSNLTECISAHLTYSLAHHTANHIGFGLSARLGPVQWYLVTDSFTNMIWPQKATNINLRMGCNIVFGYKKIKSSASMRT
ncbi:MAG: DUF5723 family protein [Bacteroidales bacterium]|nr:DUF5723 family protein [Bacteroidales bacterium]